MGSKRPPAYPNRAHKSGQARIKISGKTVYLGVFGSPESHLKYQQILEEWRAGTLGVTLPVETVRSVTEVLGLFVAAAKNGERPTGPGELKHFQRLADVIEASPFGKRAAITFGPSTLDAMRHHFLGLGWCRRYASRHLVRIKTVWRWAELNDFLPPNSWSHLRTLPIGTGQVEDEVPPVPEDDLAKTIPELARIPRAMVELQLLTAARPGEVMKLRPSLFRFEGDIRIGRTKVKLGKVWVADLGQEHKTGWRGHRKLIFFGPKAQLIVKPFLSRLPDAFLFSPLEASLEYLAAARRKDGRPVCVRVRRNRAPGGRYTIFSYRDVIKRACKRAGVSAWSAGQLRHNAATRLAEEFSPEVARLVLGHRELTMTRNYVADDLRRAAEAIEKAG